MADAPDMTLRLLREMRNEMRERFAEVKAELDLVFETATRIERRMASLEGAVLTHSTRLEELEDQVRGDG